MFRGQGEGVEVAPAAEWMRSPACGSRGSRSWGRHHSCGMAAVLGNEVRACGGLVGSVGW